MMRVDTQESTEVTPGQPRVSSSDHELLRGYGAEGARWSGEELRRPVPGREKPTERFGDYKREHRRTIKAVASKLGVLGWNQRCKLSEITDGTSSTLAIGEYSTRPAQLDVNHSTLRNWVRGADFGLRSSRRATAAAPRARTS